MSINFVKMHGLGNDFMVINNTNGNRNYDEYTIRLLADRNRGVGFDQLIVLERADYQHNQFFYRLFNADGSEVFQCGNGARCLAKYLLDSALMVGNSLTLQTTTAAYQVTTSYDEIVVNMGEPIFTPSDIPYLSDKPGPLLTERIDDYVFGVCSLGNPHAVIICDDLTTIDVAKIGGLINQHYLFPSGVNVGFLHIIDNEHIKLRVYERGVGETQACGSGACAAVVIGIVNKLLANKVTVQLPGGNLVINWKLGTGVMMHGGATMVYTGNLTTDWLAATL